MKFTLAVIGFVFAVVLFFHYHQDVPKDAGKEPPLTGWHRSVVQDGPAVAARWQKAIERALAQHRSRIPTDLVIGIMLTESMGKPRAKNPSGAAGLLGVKPVVCQELRVRECNLLNPHRNISLGVQYLRLLQKYGFRDEKLILAYGVGPRRAKEILKTDTSARAHRYVQRVAYARKIGKMHLANS